MATQKKALNAQIVRNPWANAYWYARMLISSDKYPGIASKNNTLLSEISSSIETILAGTTSTEEKIAIAKTQIRKLIQDRFTRAKSKHSRIERFMADLEGYLQTELDLKVFGFTCSHIMIPINNAIEEIPSDDKAFAIKLAESYMENLGEKGLVKIISFWDDLGLKGSIDAERTAILREFMNFMPIVSNLDDFEKGLVITAFVQEFERRAGQKRKSRAGGSLEDVTSFIFDHFGIKAESQPDHFQADIEVDKWFRAKDQWLIGVSCKRTLRERWKQVTSADRNVLSRYKIKQIWHLITFDSDLSDDKLSLLGSLDHIVYLPDNSEKLIRASQHIGLKAYVRPMSQFIKDIKAEQKASYKSFSS